MTRRARKATHDAGAARASDPLYHGVALRRVCERSVLGVLVRFESNSAVVMQAVDATFPARGQDRTSRATDAQVRVRLILHEGVEGPGERIPISYRLPDEDRVVMHTQGSLAIADARRREGIAYLTRAFLGQFDHLCFGILEPLVLVLVTQLDRHPVHAAVVGRGDTALVLAAPAGTGKSTLAYAAMRAGLTVFADDGAYIQTRPSLRLWGAPGRLYLPPDTRRWFPELARHRPRRLATGKTKLVIEPRRPRGNSGRPATRVGVCLIERTGGPLRVARVGALTLKRALWTGLGVQLPMYRSTAGPALTGLCQGGGWRLNLSKNPEQAVGYLERMLDEIAKRPRR